MQNNDFMDYSEEAVTFEVADTGVYELEIENAELKKTEGGKNYIALTFVIRDDVEQNFAGVKVWDNIWENEVHRDPNKKNKRIKKDDYEALSPTQKQNIITRMEYDDYKIRTLVHAQDVDKFIKDENGNEVQNPAFNTKFGNIEEVVVFLNGLCVQAKVLKYTDDKSGNERNSIEFKDLKRTSVSRETASSDDEEELPF